MTNTACIVARDINGHQYEWGRAFATGLQKHGWKTRIERNPCGCDLLVLWGVRREQSIANQKAAGGQVCVLERGYVGDRFKWTSVSFGGGLNGRGVFRGPLDDASRWEKHFAGLMKPWRGVRGGPVVIMGQVPGDMSVKGVDLPAFYRRAADKFRAAGFDVAFRTHPLARGSMPDIARSEGDLADVLRNAAVVVTWNSNSGVDAVLAGVPTVAMDEGSMAWPVTGHEMCYPPSPPRESWAHALAWKQWRLEEMESGECWAAVGGGSVEWSQAA